MPGSGARSTSQQGAMRRVPRRSLHGAGSRPAGSRPTPTGQPDLGRDNGRPRRRRSGRALVRRGRTLGQRGRGRVHPHRGKWLRPEAPNHEGTKRSHVREAPQTGVGWRSNDGNETHSSHRSHKSKWAGRTRRGAKREEELGDRRQGQILRGDGMTPRGGGVGWQMAEASRKH